MEKFLLPRPEVEQKLQEFVEARLHTDLDDDVLPVALVERMESLQKTLVGHKGLPMFVLVDTATEEKLAMRNYTMNSGAFIAFLQKADRPSE